MSELMLSKWDGCYPGNVNLEVAVREALARIAELEAANAKLADEVAFLKDPQGYPDLW